MASTFVRVTNPEDIFELWVAGLLYNKYDGTDSSINFCEWTKGTDIAAAREHYLPFWRRGEGIEPDDVYGFMQED